MWNPIKKTLKKISSTSSSRHSWSSVSAQDDMLVDSSRPTSVSKEDTTPAVPRSRVCVHIRILEMIEQIVAGNNFEREALELLEKQSFSQIKIFEPLFLIKMGLRQDMNCAFAYAGLEDFTDITEVGSQLLTTEFLMSLSIEETGKTTKIYFRFFNEQYELTLKELSVALGFNKKCLLDPNALTKDHQYDCTTWWNSISKEPVSCKNSIVSIHNPTLRLLAKWLCMVVRPCSELCLCSSPKLQCLFAMAHKVR
jgi:hypothetical protein